MFPNNNLDSYQRQANDILAKIGQLQQYQPPIPNPAIVPRIDYVKGMDGAKEFLSTMPAGGNKVLMDQDEAIFYVVSKDANGVPAPVMFARFELETEKKPEAPVYVTKADFDNAMNELKAMLKGDKE